MAKMGWHSGLESNFKKVTKEIEDGSRKQVYKAVDLVHSAVKAKVKKIKKHSGNLEKGLYKLKKRGSGFVGFKPPAYHAWFLEFGTEARFTRKRKGKRIDPPANRGRMPAMPILYPTFAEQASAVAKILSEPWVK